MTLLVRSNASKEESGSPARQPTQAPSARAFKRKAACVSEHPVLACKFTIVGPMIERFSPIPSMQVSKRRVFTNRCGCERTSRHISISRFSVFQDAGLETKSLQQTSTAGDCPDCAENKVGIATAAAAAREREIETVCDH